MTLASALQERDERLESLYALVGRLAHDFKNQMVPHLGYVALIKEEAAGHPAIPAFADKLEKSARKTESYLESILMAVRPQRRFSPKPLDFAQLVSKELAAWRSQLPAAAAITVESDLAPCGFWGDEKQWELVCRHLLSNARLALPTGGTVALSICPAELSAEKARDLQLPPGPFWKWTVQDNGLGMQPSILARACEPFFTTRLKGHALGLGLSVAHSIVRLHNGQLVLESQEAEGTRVTVWVPREGMKALPARPAALSRDERSSAAPERPKILLACEDASVREGLASHLAGQSLEVVAVGDGHEALKAFERGKTTLAAALVEANLPKLNARQLSAEAVKLGLRAPLLVMGHEPEPRQADADPWPGTVHYLRKPIPLRALAERLQAVIQGRA